MNIISQSNDHILGISKILLLFIVLVFSNFTDVLVSKQIKIFIKNNRHVQHILGYIMLLIIVDTSYSGMEFYKVVLYTVIVYILFIMTNKLDIHWNIIIFFILLIAFIYENRKDHEIKVMKKDENLTIEEKEKIEKENQRFRYGVLILIVFIISLGTIFYNDKKMIQYGGSYDPIKYFFQ
jgi:hypothetical protein